MSTGYLDSRAAAAGQPGESFLKKRVRLFDKAHARCYNLSDLLVRQTRLREATS